MSRIHDAWKILTGRASVENPSVSFNDADFWEDLGPGTQTGVNVSHTSALKYSPVWSAVSLISGSVAKLPLQLYRKTPAGREELETPLADMV